MSQTSLADLFGLGGRRAVVTGAGQAVVADGGLSAGW
jgi:hypothetical protein